jgi:transcriptional regulator with XRE-family HTH domain
MDNHFGTRLRTAIMNTTGSVNNFAMVVGMGLPHLSHILSGSRVPSFETLSKILEALPSTDSRWLIIGEPT